MCLGKVANILDENQYKIEFLTKKGRRNKYFIFPEIPDIRNVSTEEIICKLELNRIDDEKYFFNNNNLI